MFGVVLGCGILAALCFLRFASMTSGGGFLHCCTSCEMAGRAEMEFRVQEERVQGAMGEKCAEVLNAAGRRPVSGRGFVRKDEFLPWCNYDGQRNHKVLFVCKAVLLSGLLIFFAMMWKSYVLAAAAGLVVAQQDDAAVLEERQAKSSASSNVPQYFQTEPEFLPGPTPTGPAAFLAQTNPAPFAGTVSRSNSKVSKIWC